jgi:hypothetical protein
VSYSGIATRSSHFLATRGNAMTLYTSDLAVEQQFSLREFNTTADRSTRMELARGNCAQPSKCVPPMSDISRLMSCWIPTGSSPGPPSLTDP